MLMSLRWRLWQVLQLIHCAYKNVIWRSNEYVWILCSIITNNKHAKVYGQAWVCLQFHREGGPFERVDIVFLIWWASQLSRSETRKTHTADAPVILIK